MAKATKARISADEKRWRAQDALSTLTRAEQIRADKSLMADVKKYAQAQVQTLSKVAGGDKPAPAKSSTAKRNTRRK